MQILKRLLAWTEGGKEEPEAVTASKVVYNNESSSLEKKSGFPKFTKLEDLINNSDVSTRLKNVIKHSDFPFATVQEYLQHPAPIEALKRVQNVGSKTAKELDLLIQRYLNQPTLLKLMPDSSIEIESANSSFEKIENKVLLQNKVVLLLKNYPFPAVLQELPLSARLMNVLKHVEGNQERKFNNFADCILYHQDFIDYFLRQQNFGRKSLSELQAILHSTIAFILKSSGASKDLAERVTAYIFSQSDGFLSEAEISQFLELNLQSKEIVAFQINSAFPDTPLGIDDNLLQEEILLKLIQSVLSSREYDIIKKRFGLEGNKSRTLEEIAKEHNCTRERIRQLEKKALKKLTILKKPFLLNLHKFSGEVEKILFDDLDYFPLEETAKQFKTLPGQYRLAIEVAYGGIKNYMRQHFSIEKSFWLSKSAEPNRIDYAKQLIRSNSAYKPLEKRIRVLNHLKWPVSLTDLHSKIPDVSIEIIRTELIKSFDANIENDVIKSLKNLRSSLRLIIILRYVGRALSLAEARYHHAQIFREDMLEHNIGAVLGRLEEALIVDRGKYALYENISLSRQDIRTIREECFNYLTERQIYTSTKRIFDDLYLGQHPYGADFNPYMLLGILQDDTTFVSKRGLMIGLNTFSEEDFVGLNQRIYKIVNDYGPIDLKGIQTQLAADRKVLDVTVNIVLEDSAEHIKIGPSRYDRIDRVIGNLSIQKNLKYATEIALMEGELSPYYLKKKLSALGYELDEYVFSSWLGKQDNIRKNTGAISLEIPCKEVTEYKNTLLQLADHPKYKNKNFVRERLPVDSRFFVDLDTRFSEHITKNIEDSHSDELHNLVKEFDF